MEVNEPVFKYMNRARRILTTAGELPEDWCVMPIGGLMRLINGRAFSPADWSDTGLPIIRIQNLNDLDAEFNFYPEAVDERNIVRPGDLLFAWSGTTGSSFGARVWTGPIGVLNQHIFKVIPDQKKLSPTYAYRLLAKAQQAIERQAHGFKASFVHVKKSDLVSVHVGFPPNIDEQDQIAAAISNADALIDSLEQLLAKKGQIKHGAMQELLTGKRRLPGYKDSWVPRSMADLFEFSGGLSASRDQLGEVGACYLHYGDIHISNKTYIDLDLEHHKMPRLEVDLRKVSPTALLRNGDVVFVDASEDDQGVSKHVAIHCQVARPLISGLHTIVARPKSDELVDLYKRYCFQAPSVHAQFRFYAVGTKVSGVSKGNIGKIILDVPSPAEQAEIAACLVEIDAEIDALEDRLTKARALKQAMAQALLTGRIRLVEPTA